jgi:hypothetical protein
MLLLIQLLKHFRTQKDRDAITEYLLTIENMSDIEDFLNACGVKASTSQKYGLLRCIERGTWRSAFNLVEQGVV